MKQRAIFPLIQNIIGIKNDNPNYNKDYQKVKITYSEIQCHVETERVKTENKESIVQTIAKVIHERLIFSTFWIREFANMRQDCEFEYVARCIYIYNIIFRRFTAK